MENVKCGLVICCLMAHAPSFLSAEFVKEHSNLLLAAVKFYKEQHHKTMDDSTRAVLHELMGRVESYGIVQRECWRLLRDVVSEFEGDLRKRYRESYSNKARIKEWLDELGEEDFRSDLYGKTLD